MVPQRGFAGCLVRRVAKDANLGFPRGFQVTSPADGEVVFGVHNAVGLQRRQTPNTKHQTPDSEGQFVTPDPGSAIHGLQFIRGDAQRLPFVEGSFDIVTVGYGLRNLASWEAGLEEMQRVAKPGGRLLVLDFGKPNNRLWRGLYFSYLRFFVPCLGRVFCGDARAYAYILESLKHYPAQEGVAAKMRALGLVNVLLVNLLGGVMSINYGEKRAGK
jgi:SAM-dependent methyltransferase